MDDSVRAKNFSPLQPGQRPRGTSKTIASIPFRVGGAGRLLAPWGRARGRKAPSPLRSLVFLSLLRHTTDQFLSRHTVVFSG